MERQSSKQASFKDLYEEIKIIGKGNFGACSLVKDKTTGEQFISKKIILAGLDDKEKQGSLQEANLLRHLKHPHIVSYITSFIDKDSLYIIMEYCEVGDLANHIKKTKKSGGFLTEEEILNWFIQIAISLEYIHGRRILHRDIKS